jgi:hypothetical protein
VLSGRIAEVVYLGEDLQVLVDVQDGISLAVNLKATLAEKELVQGTAVSAWIAREDVRILPAAEASHT